MRCCVIKIITKFINFPKSNESRCELPHCFLLWDELTLTASSSSSWWVEAPFNRTFGSTLKTRTIYCSIEKGRKNPGDKHIHTFHIKMSMTFAQRITSHHHNKDGKRMKVNTTGGRTRISFSSVIFTSSMVVVVVGTLRTRGSESRIIYRVLFLDLFSPPPLSTISMEKRSNQTISIINTNTQTHARSCDFINTHKFYEPNRNFANHNYFDVKSRNSLSRAQQQRKKKHKNTNTANMCAMFVWWLVNDDDDDNDDSYACILAKTLKLSATCRVSEWRNTLTLTHTQTCNKMIVSMSVHILILLGKSNEMVSNFCIVKTS